MNTRSLFTTLLLFFSFSAAASAADAGGEWKWEMRRPNGDARETVAKFKQEGSKLTGTIAGPQGNEMPIHEGKVSDDGKVAFALKFEREGNTFTVNFSGTLEGDTINGKTEFTNRDGETRSRDWTAKRTKSSAAEKAAHSDVDGKWRTTFNRDDGSTMELIVKLKQDGEKLTGTTMLNNSNEREISEGRIKGSEITFTSKGERDGRQIVSKFRGKVEGKAISGTIDSNYSGEDMTYEWEAKKVE